MTPPVLPESQRPRLARAVYLGLGLVFVGLGAVGAVLPVLPTTPFLLLAAACWGRSSDRLSRWLLEHRVFGPTLRTWRERRSLPPGVKAKAITLVVVAFAVSIVLGVEATALRLLLGATGLGLIVFLARLPTWHGEHGKAAEARRVAL